MPRVWVRLIKNNKIKKQETECLKSSLPAVEGAREALGAALRRLDEPRPFWLPGHVRQFLSYGQAKFLPEHFMEDVWFDRMEIETID